MDHADQLARRFEECDPDDANEVPVQYLRRRAVLDRARSERHVVEAAAAARTAEISWTNIGQILGTSAQAVQQRHGGVIEQV